MAPTGHRERAAGAFYGRRKGKALRPHQQMLLDMLLPRLRIDNSVPPPRRLAELFSGRIDAVHLEIGFGGGERLIEAAARHAEIGHIGIEPFVNGMAKALARIDEMDIANIRLFDDDAARLLDWLPAGSLSCIDLFYPDPWPKKRHWKRRFVNRANLDRIARALKPDGMFRFVSDVETYVNWTLRHCLAHPDFEWTAQRPADWKEPWREWLRTRYEAKAVREDRIPAYLVFRRK